MMPHNKKPSNNKNKHFPEEPVYVDDAFSEEEIVQDDPWSEEAELQPLKLDATLEELIEEATEEETSDQEPPVQKSAPSKYKSFRVNISPKRASPVTPQTKKDKHPSIPETFPRTQKPKNYRTGSWPVAPASNQNGTKPSKIIPKSPSPIPDQPKPAPKSQNNPMPRAKDENPVKRSNREISPVIEFLPSPRSIRPSRPAPPPVLPVMPIQPATSSQKPDPVEELPPVFPIQKSQSGNSFQPLLDEKTASMDSLQDLDDADVSPTERQRDNLFTFIGNGKLPQNSLILGVCQDGLPLVLELSDPTAGALLFLGEKVEEMQAHLQAVIASVCLLSEPTQVQIDIISPNPEQFFHQLTLAHINNIHEPSETQVFDMLGDMFELVESRQRKENSLTAKLFGSLLPASQKSPIRILMIDQLDVLVSELAPDSLSYLRWLLRRGPASNVWVLASLNTLNAAHLDQKTLKAFGLQIAGKFQDSPAIGQLTTIPIHELSSLEAGEACIKLDQEAIHFSILEI